MAYTNKQKEREWYRKNHQKRKDDPNYKQRRKESAKRDYEVHRERYRKNDRAWSAKNKEKLRAKFKKWYAANRERNIATRKAWAEKNKAYLHAYRHRPDVVKKRNEWARQNSVRMRELVVGHYGGVCVCCKESNIKFLTIDHINGGGNQHRRDIKVGGGKSFYYWLRNQGYPGGYRVLCMSCNWASAMYKICPHDATRGARAVTLSDVDLSEVVGL